MTSPSDPKDRRALGSWQRPGRGVFVYANDQDSHDFKDRAPVHGSWLQCPGSVSGHDNGDRDGNCTWCGRRVNSPVPRPELGEAYRTELRLAYEYHFNPDYGDDPYAT